MTRLRGRLNAVDPKNLNQIILAEGKNINKQIPETASQSKVIALTSIMAALIAVTTMIAIPLPPPLSTLTLAPIVIFITSILLGPSAGLVSAAIGSAIGFIAGANMGTIMVLPGYFYVFLFGIVIARAPMGLIVGLLRKKNEIIAMVVGVLTETVIFFVADTFLFGIAGALITLGTFADLIYVPISYGILKAVRNILKITYLAC